MLVIRGRAAPNVPSILVVLLKRHSSTHQGSTVDEPRKHMPGMIWIETPTGLIQMDTFAELIWIDT